MLSRILPSVTGSLCCGAHSDVQTVSPARALQLLKEGNVRYCAGQVDPPRSDAERRRETYDDGQHPYAALLSCADSRVPLEIIFNAGIGDLFAVRVAGNVCNNDQTASLEYAVEHLKIPLCVVLGHTRCGAVTAVVKDVPLPDTLVRLTQCIRDAASIARRENPGADDADLVEATARANVRLSVEQLKASPPVRERISQGHLAVIGAMYDLATGRVEWFE